VTSGGGPNSSSSSSSLGIPDFLAYGDQPNGPDDEEELDELDELDDELDPPPPLSPHGVISRGFPHGVEMSPL
jgi:hypothetical protein